MEIDQAIESLVDAVTDGLRKLPELTANPHGTIFHFTDAGGVLGILCGKNLRATRAVCMNDTSELTFGMALARSIVLERLKSTSASALRPVWEEALQAFDQASSPPLGKRLKMDAFVISLCERIDKSVHWLHYGRGGFGYALGFDPGCIAQEGWSLVKVIYKGATQKRVILDLLGGFEESTVALLQEYAKTPLDVARLHATAGQLMMNFSAMVAPCFKHSAFEAEEEWRLFKVTIEGQSLATANQLIKFRNVGAIITPYIELPLGDLSCLREIVTGSQVPEDPVNESLRLLLQSLELDPATVKVSKSTVPVRGAA